MAELPRMGRAYNRAMRAVTPLLLLALATGPALAQNTSQNTHQPTSDVAHKLSNQEQKSNRSEQRTERIHLEDGGNSVDELRVGGQTKTITVQPKGSDLPAYEVQPSDGVRNRSRNGAETTTGPRVWNLMKF